MSFKLPVSEAQAVQDNPSNCTTKLCLSKESEALYKDSLRFRVRQFGVDADFYAENPHRFSLPNELKRSIAQSETPRLKGLIFRYGAFIEPATIQAQSLVCLVSNSAAEPGGLRGWEVVQYDQVIRRLHRILFGTWALVVQDLELCMDIYSDRDGESFPERLLP